MPIGPGRDFPIWTGVTGRDSFQRLLADLGSVKVEPRQAERMVRKYPWACCSGRVEAFLVVYAEQGLSRGMQRWPGAPVVAGYVTIADAAELVDRKRPTIHNWINRGELEAVKVEGRTLVSLASLERHLTPDHHPVPGWHHHGLALPRTLHHQTHRRADRAASASEQLGGFVHGMFTDSGAQSGT